MVERMMEKGMGFFCFFKECLTEFQRGDCHFFRPLKLTYSINKGLNVFIHNFFRNGSPYACERGLFSKQMGHASLLSTNREWNAGRRRRHVPATPIIIRSADIAHPLSSKQ